MLALLDPPLQSGVDPEDEGQRALAWRGDSEYARGKTVVAAPAPRASEK
jgi:hypothetical protein